MNVFEKEELPCFLYLKYKSLGPPDCPFKPIKPTSKFSLNCPSSLSSRQVGRPMMIVSFTSAKLVYKLPHFPVLPDACHLSSIRKSVNVIVSNRKVLILVSYVLLHIAYGFSANSFLGNYSFLNLFGNCS